MSDVNLELDKRATKKNVEAILGKYSQVVKKIKIMKAVDSDVANYLTTTLKIGLDILSVKGFLSKMDLVFEELNKEQQVIISEKYIKNFGAKLDCDILDEIKIPERTYYRYKMQAILLMADMLNLNQYK